ncbi:MAG TPA: DUF3035 domain-containing protein [Rhizomicrobium sp.]|nr:DUF3035 domain-containing protein [Rhizomicrobium sp.]
MIEYRMRNLLRGCALAAMACSLMACQSIRDAAGLTKEPPDEFAVVTKAPLIIPPDFNLHPPKPGAPPLNQVAPTTAAQEALYSDDPNAIANAISGNYSEAEKLLLANSGGAVADPSIRRTIAADNTKAEDTDPSLTDRLLFGESTDNSADKAVNAAAEQARLAAIKDGDQPPPGKASATIGASDDSSKNSDDSGSSWWPF